MGEGPPSRHKTEAEFHLKRRRQVFPALSRGRLRPHAAGPLLPHTHQDPGARPASPGAALRRRQSRSLSAGGADARPCRRAAPLWPSRSRALPRAGPALLPPARLTPCPPGPRPRLGGRTHRLAPRLRRAPQGPADWAGRWRGESGGAGDRAARPRRTPDLGGTTGL